MTSKSPNMIFILLLAGVLVLIVLLKKDKGSKTKTTDVNEQIRPSQFMIQVYKNQSEQRANIVKAYRKFQNADFLDIYNVIVPEVFCAEMVRVGTVGDGGKWMCSPQNLPPACSIFSLGLSNAISFDVHLQKLSEKRCRLFGYDIDDQHESIQKELAEWNGQSKKAKIGGASDGGISIEELMKREKIDRVEILKIDIEGGEFTALLPFLEKHIVAQIMIEIHSSKNAFVMVDLVAKIAEHGYWIAAYEINGRYHELCEFLLIHESSFERYGATPLARYMV